MDSTGEAAGGALVGCVEGGGVLVVESVLTGGPDRPRPSSMVTVKNPLALRLEEDQIDSDFVFSEVMWQQGVGV